MPKKLLHPQSTTRIDRRASGRRRLSAILATLVFTLGAVVIATPAIASPLLTGGLEVDNNIFFFGRNSMQGLDFTATSDSRLTALGFWDFAQNGLSSAFEVGLWHTTTQSLLAQATIDSSDALDSSLILDGGAWRYETLASAVLLTTGTTYTLGFQVGPQDMSPEDSFLISNATRTTRAGFNVETGGRFLLTPDFTFPSYPDDVFGFDFGRGNVNAQIVPIPEPSTAVLLSLGIMGLAARRRLEP